MSDAKVLTREEVVYNLESLVRRAGDGKYADALRHHDQALRAQRDALAEELAKLQKKYEQADVERGLMACLVMESWEAKQVMADRDEYELAKQIMALQALAAAPEAGKP